MPPLPLALQIQTTSQKPDAILQFSKFPAQSFRSSLYRGYITDQTQNEPGITFVIPVGTRYLPWGGRSIQPEDRQKTSIFPAVFPKHNPFAARKSSPLPGGSMVPSPPYFYRSPFSSPRGSSFRLVTEDSRLQPQASRNCDQNSRPKQSTGVHRGNPIADAG